MANSKTDLYYSGFKNTLEDKKPFYGNIMYDKRVIRGNTWALRRIAQEQLKGGSPPSWEEKQQIVREKIENQLHRKLGGPPIKTKNSGTNAVANSKPRRIIERSKFPSLTSPINQRGKRSQVNAGGRLPLLKSTERKSFQSSISEAVRLPRIPSAQSEKSFDWNETELIPDTEKDSDQETDFSEKVDSVIGHVVDKVLSEAKIEVESEAEIAELEEKRQDLSRLKHRQEDTISQLEESLSEAQKQNAEVELEKRRWEKESLRLACRQAVWELVEEMLPKAMEKLEEEGLLDPPIEERTKAVDTSEMQAMIAAREKAEKDVSWDFIPWLFNRVSHSVAHSFAEILLQDAMFSTSEPTRTKAKEIVDVLSG